MMSILITTMYLTYAYKTLALEIGSGVVNNYHAHQHWHTHVQENTALYS